MPLLNFSTKVPATSSVAEVQQRLVKAGARQMMAEYDGSGIPTALGFTLETEYGLRSFLLPVNAAKVEAVLYRQRREPSMRPNMLTREHANRVAWRILKDWIEAQLAITETEMVTLDQVMLPYMRTGDGSQTVYELFRGEQLAITTGPADA